VQRRLIRLPGVHILKEQVAGASQRSVRLIQALLAEQQPPQIQHGFSQACCGLKVGCVDAKRLAIRRAHVLQALFLHLDRRVFSR